MSRIHTEYRFASRTAITIGLITGFTPSVTREPGGWGSINVPDSVSPHIDFIESQLNNGETPRTIAKLVRQREEAAS